MNDVENFISQLERQRSAIDRAISALRAMADPIKGGVTTATANTGQPAGGKRRISPKARARMAEGARERWAAKKKESTQKPSPTERSAEGSSPENTPRKRRLSPEGRRAIIEATKKRWAAKRAAVAGRSAAVRKK